jgi:hypothetical protein
MRFNHEFELYIICCRSGRKGRVFARRREYDPKSYQRPNHVLNVPRQKESDISGLRARIPPAGRRACSSGGTSLRGASGMVGMGAYSVGSKMPTVL